MKDDQLRFLSQKRVAHWSQSRKLLVTEMMGSVNENLADITFLKTNRATCSTIGIFFHTQNKKKQDLL